MVEGRGLGVSVCVGGNICFKATRGLYACVFDLASAKLVGVLFHGQHVACGINKRK